MMTNTITMTMTMAMTVTTALMNVTMIMPSYPWVMYVSSPSVVMVTMPTIPMGFCWSCGD
jgi:hypothetical protein